VPTIVVTGAFDDGVAVESLRAGADDFVVKSNLQRLVPGVRAAIAVREPLRLLTPRQLEVFRLVAEGLSTREIADKLGISIKTVETHRTALMKRLDVHDVVALVHYAVRVKLVRP
jgi:DNA-binding NarL/FixJ family response regulator